MRSENIEQNWLVTMRMALALKKSGQPVEETLGLLKSAKTLLNQCRIYENTDPGTLSEAETLVDRAQSEVFLKSEPLGKAFQEKWDGVLKRVMRGEKVENFTVQKAVFYPGMPRNEKWIRIKPSKSLTKKRLDDIAKSTGVEVKPHEDNHILIVGSEDALKEAIKEISQYMKKKKGKRA